MAEMRVKLSPRSSRPSREAIGLEVLAIEVLDAADAPTVQLSSATEPGNPLEVSGTDLRDVPEKDIWSDSPSQWSNFWWFAVCVPGFVGAGIAIFSSSVYALLLLLLLIPVPWAVWKAISTRRTDFAITSQRLTLETGVFRRLYRIKDTTLTRSFVQRLIGLGTVTVISSDESMPTLVIPAIRGAAEVRQIIRENVELVRRARGVRELDMN